MKRERTSQALQTALLMAVQDLSLLRSVVSDSVRIREPQTPLLAVETAARMAVRDLHLLRKVCLEKSTMLK